MIDFFFSDLIFFCFSIYSQLNYFLLVIADYCFAIFNNCFCIVDMSLMNNTVLLRFCTSHTLIKIYNHFFYVHTQYQVIVKYNNSIGYLQLF